MSQSKTAMLLVSVHEAIEEEKTRQDASARRRMLLRIGLAIALVAPVTFFIVG